MLTFAIGDIHGCFSLLDRMLGLIAARAGSEPHRILCLGDYVDRGPDSAGVIARLRALEQQGEVVCLKGNHEDVLLRAVADARRDGGWWLDLGGDSTLASFGVRRAADLPADVLAWIAASRPSSRTVAAISSMRGSTRPSGLSSSVTTTGCGSGRRSSTRITMSAASSSTATRPGFGAARSCARTGSISTRAPSMAGA